MKLVLSIDLGTTNLKVAVVNKKGEILALRRSQIPVYKEELGAAEHDPREVYEIMAAICREISKPYKHDIANVVISTYQLGLILLDEHFLPLTKISLLSDVRAKETFADFTKEAESLDLYKKTACPLMFQYVLPRIYYFKKRDPKLFAKAKHIMGAKEYLLFLLTGEILTEPSVAATTQMLNINTLEWDDDICQRFEIEKDSLPRIVDGITTEVPILTSVRKELGFTSTKLTVMPGLYDGGALALGLSGFKKGIAVMNIGTSAMFRVPGEKPIMDFSPSKRLSSYFVGINTYFNGGALNNAALAINWLRDTFVELDFSDVPELGETKGAPLFCLPYLIGERDIEIGQFGSGAFIGLRDYHTRRDMLRSMMEGVAYSLCLVKESLVKEGGQEISEIRVGGGGANSKTWIQIFADIFNLPISIPGHTEAGVVGNAAIAYCANKTYNSLVEAQENMVSIEERFIPNPLHVEKYKEYFEFFKFLRSNLIDIYKAHSKLSNVAQNHIDFTDLKK